MEQIHQVDIFIILALALVIVIFYNVHKQSITLVHTLIASNDKLNEMLRAITNKHNSIESKLSIMNERLGMMESSPDK